jgi:hypothetical protein
MIATIQPTASGELIFALSAFAIFFTVLLFAAFRKNRIAPEERQRRQFVAVHVLRRVQ